MTDPAPPGSQQQQSMLSTDNTLYFTELKVDIRSLADFADALKQEYETNLKPALARLKAMVESGPQFGLHPDLGDAAAKHDSYDRYLRNAYNLYRDLVTGTWQLAVAAEQIGAHYSKADQFSKVTVNDVTAVLRPTPPASGTGGNEHGYR